MDTLNDKEFKIIAHTLGINLYDESTQLPNEFYRNYFCATVNHSDFPTLSDLHLKGLMNTWTKFDNIYFGVTEKGINLFRLKFSEYYQSSKYPIKDCVFKIAISDSYCTYEYDLELSSVYCIVDIAKTLFQVYGKKYKKGILLKNFKETK